MSHDRIADTFPMDAGLDQVGPTDFDALMLPVGALNSDFLRVQPKAQWLARQIDRDGKPMAIICHAPWLLISVRWWRVQRGMPAVVDNQGCRQQCAVSPARLAHHRR